MGRNRELTARIEELERIVEQMARDHERERTRLAGAGILLASLSPPEVAAVEHEQPFPLGTRQTRVA